ncbi:MAG: hypothetical protein AAF604_21260 [Acidobacteriota bacterium]
MNRWSMVLVTLICLALATAGLTAAPASEEKEAEKIDFSELLVKQSSEDQRLNYPSCFAMNGRSCPVAGSTQLCLLAPFEPEICVCGTHGGSTLTLRCLWY